MMKSEITGVEVFISSNLTSILSYKERKFLLLVGEGQDEVNPGFSCKRLYSQSLISVALTPLIKCSSAAVIRVC
jgi:hypothetical protein